MSLAGGTYRVFLRELRRLGSFRTLLLLTTVLPLSAFLYFIVLLDKGVPSDIPIAVLDYDNSSLSRQVTRMIDATRSASVRYRITDMLEGERMMREGTIDAVVEIPRHMERDIYSTSQAKIIAYINGTNVTKNGMLDRDIRTTLYSFSSGIEIQTLVTQGIPEVEAYQMMMPVYYEKHVLFNPFTNYSYYLLPLFFSMTLLIFIMMTTVFSVGVELKDSTAPQWLEASGGNLHAAVIGKLLPYTIWFVVMSLCLNVAMFRVMGFPMRGDEFMLVMMSVLFVLAYQAIGVMFVSVFANLRLSLSVGGGYSVLAFTFSGVTFPAIAMYPFIRFLTHFFPLTFYMNVYIDQAVRGAPTAFSLPDMGYLALFLLLPLPFLPRLKRICGDPKYWGKI